MKFTPADGSAPIEHVIYDFNGGGVAMGMYNTDEVCFEWILFVIFFLLLYPEKWCTDILRLKKKMVFLFVIQIKKHKHYISSCCSIS